ncbi:S9 family peptidase [Egibacter rhizosphaerae]|uniref:S9 family peptidase n=1 Tax=Egibacter rhizosphaerae TaxID=1670831 RepID=A0A411YD41_9ACTN|nr:S9 family peptidase [Egibacter rhizosphaerae]QBI19108.1 S9 family peptidase [Egibacter rhizosphaerae]
MSNHDTPHFDLETFLAMPRVSGLAVHPEGHRLVVGVAEPDPDGTRFRTALWTLDPDGAAPRRLTRSVPGEAAPTLLPDGRLLFTSKRVDPDVPSSERDDDVAGLWELPLDGGEPRLLADPPGGVGSVAVARDAGRVLLSSPLHEGTADFEADAERGKARKDAKVSAQLVERYPARFWDRWLGPRSPQLFTGDAVDPRNEARPEWTAATPGVHGPLELATATLDPQGRTIVTTWSEDPDDLRSRVTDLVAIDLDSNGEPRGRRTLLAEPRVRYGSPAVSPDGGWVACVRAPIGMPDAPHDMTLAIVPLDGGTGAVDLLPGFDRWPQAPVWTPDGDAVLFTADDDGRTLPFRVEIEADGAGGRRGGAVTRLAAEGAFSDLAPTRDGRTLYALRSQVSDPHRVVALDPVTPDQVPGAVPTPGDATRPEATVPPGRVERVDATADDGVRIPGWLVRPPEEVADGPAPLAVFIHGGPLSSWSGWHWRWCPHVLAARGWAVLLPDPALSTGYGYDYIARGWGRWGAEPYTDLMALVEEVAARDDVDAARTAAMGGSFGGYMANWIAGHTNRFDAIVTHASLWNLEAFHGTTDNGPLWENEFGDRYTEPERYREWSPHRFVDRITTPMLVIHGERDFRVPVSEGLTLWTDLRRHGVESQYLHFPDENHWVLTPQHARIWYETVLAFLDHHVLGEPFERPELL